MQIVVTHTRQPQYLQHMMWQCTSKRSMQVCFTHLAASIFSAYNIAPISPVYNVAIYIKRRMRCGNIHQKEVCNVAIYIKKKYATWQYRSKRRVYLTHLAAPISPAAWRHLSPGDILFAASGVPGSWPESERTVPPELLACSFLPAALEHVSSVIIRIIITMMIIIIIIVVVEIMRNHSPAHDELGTCADKSCLSSLSCASLKGL